MRRQPSFSSSSSFGPVTRDQIREADLFFAALMGTPTPIRAIEAEDTAYDPAFKALELSPSSTHGGTPMRDGLTRAMLTRIMPKLGRASEAIQQRYLDLTNEMFRLFAIDTIESRAFFLAHAFVESGEFASMVEGDHREPYRERVRGSTDPAWTPQHVTAGQAAEFRRWNYHNRPEIMGRGNFLYIGRGPLQITFSRGYRRAREVMNVWGQEYGRTGAIEDSSKLLHAVGELSGDPALAAVPEYAFLLSGAHFKSARPGSSGGVRSMDKSASSTAPLRADQFLAASASMAGVGSFTELNRSVHKKHIADNLNRKMPVFREAIKAMCGSATTGICGNPAVAQPAPRITLP
jgi:hypothetical protein